MRAYLLEACDIAPLVFFRVFFGGIMLWEVWRYFANDWIARHFIKPRLLFPYMGFEWLKPWPGELMYLHFALLGVFAACIMLGLFYRLSTIGFFLGFSYIFALDRTLYLNHFYLICLISFLMVLVPAHRVFSLDVHFRKVSVSETAPRWALWIILFQIGVAYVYGGIAKINGDWLQGQPMGIWLSRRRDFPLIGLFFNERWMALLFSYSGLLIDLFIVPCLLWKRTRVAAFAIVLAFHLLNAQLFQIGVFPWFMLGATLMFFPAAFHRRLLDVLSARRRHTKPRATATTAQRSASTAAVVWGVLLYALVQILVPFRHLLYPGNVDWTEEGHTFSWRMKLRTKNAAMLMVARSGDRSWRIDVEDYVNARQLEKIATRPEMIVQLAHYIADDYRREKRTQVEIYAMVAASLNGRAPQLLIDPTVNLAAQRRSLSSASWIMPLSTPAADS